MLSDNIRAIENFDFEDTSLECNECWATRIPSLMRRGARLARALGLTSVRTDRLREG